MVAEAVVVADATPAVLARVRPISVATMRRGSLLFMMLSFGVGGGIAAVKQ
jgi:hypothetical protein